MDQSLPTETEFSWVKDKISYSIDEAIASHDLDKATDLVRSLIKIAKISGRELTRVLYQFKSNWHVFNCTEAFEDWADRETGLHHHTIERYIRIESLLTKPELSVEVRKELADRNLAELFPIANMVEQGYEPTPDEWEDILIQPDETSIRTKVREIKGQEPRASALVLYMDESGSIWAVKDGTKKFVGSLELSDDSLIVRQAVDRIIKNTGILK
jgi:hypothetical protein